MVALVAGKGVGYGVGVGVWEGRENGVLTSAWDTSDG